MGKGDGGPSAGQGVVSEEDISGAKEKLPRSQGLGESGNTHKRQVVVHSLQSGLGMESRRVALPLDGCVSEGTLINLPEPQRLHL